MECYDLYGIPENLDLLYVPNNNIPKGKIQFDMIWKKYTGVSYGDLPKLDGFSIYFKSFSGYYCTRIANKYLRFKETGKYALKVIHRALP
jgi:hypothetical protein